MKAFGTALIVVGGLLIFGGLTRPFTDPRFGSTMDDIGGSIGALGVSLLILIWGISIVRKSKPKE